jgi:hypothetical protein
MYYNIAFLATANRLCNQRKRMPIFEDEMCRGPTVLAIFIIFLLFMGYRAAKTKAAKLAPRFDSPEDMSDDEEILFDDIYEVCIKKRVKLNIYIGK